jgi:hypothetical protein
MTHPHKRTSRNAGAANPLAKLTPEAVREIRSSSELQRVLADRFGVHQSEISRVRNQRLWRHL